MNQQPRWPILPTRCHREMFANWVCRFNALLFTRPRFRTTISMKKTIQTLQEFSVPLIVGVMTAMLMANVAPELYHYLIHTPLPEFFGLFGAGTEHTAQLEGWRYYTTIHFLANDILMALFFGIAAKEITEACLPNGALNPIRKAVNPLLGTVGGVLGPIAVFLGLNAFLGTPEWRNGWGIPTATDIALAWLIARLLFGKSHPAVSFLLLLAVADDAIGLGIIAIGYPDPLHPTQWSNLAWLVPGMGIAFGLRLYRVHSWVPYIALGGSFCWWGLYSAHLHPALALVFIVPFLPAPRRDLGLFESSEFDSPESDVTVDAVQSTHKHSTLETFEHDLKALVDFGLFFFAFANAGVPLAGASGLTWILLGSLVFGKTIGIVACSWFATRLGFPLPAGMNFRHLFVTSLVAALGLTVALFVSTQAFVSIELQAAAKMGAVASAGAALLAWVAAETLGVRPGESLFIKIRNGLRSVRKSPEQAPQQTALSKADA